ncbi:MAG: ADP-ribosylglycohydrolase family protein [Thermomicrobiales bacterium]
MSATPHPTAADRFLGCLLGMAIGDALGMPAIARTAATPITGYEPLLDADGGERVQAGQFTSHTELALCLVETLVSANGFIDPETAGYRFVQVLRSEHGHLLDETSRAAIERAEATGDYQSGLASDGSIEPGPAARIAPIGLVHSLGQVNAEMFVREVLRATLITHAAPDAVNGALALAWAIHLVVQRDVPPEMIASEVLAFIDEDDTARTLRIAAEALVIRASAERDEAILARIGPGNTLAEAVARALYLFGIHADSFERAVLAAANSGRNGAAVGAMAGAMAGARIGAQALPSSLVEGLEGRMYILMAAPALFRTAQRRAGLFLPLHVRP